MCVTSRVPPHSGPQRPRGGCRVPGRMNLLPCSKSKPKVTGILQTSWMPSVRKLLAWSAILDTSDGLLLTAAVGGPRGAKVHLGSPTLKPPGGASRAAAGAPHPMPASTDSRGRDKDATLPLSLPPARPELDQGDWRGPPFPRPPALPFHTHRSPYSAKPLPALSQPAFP